MSVYLHNLFSNGTVTRESALARVRIRQDLAPIFVLIPLRGQTCYRKLVAGPAGLNYAGPGQSFVNAHYLRKFRSYVLERMGVPETTKATHERPLVLVLDRTTSRRILNKDQLVEALNRRVDWDVKLVRLETMPWQYALPFFLSPRVTRMDIGSSWRFCKRRRCSSGRTVRASGICSF